MKKTDINQLFKLLTEENPEYALIYKLIYIYARKTKEILQLQKQDINIKKNTITFKINNKEVTFPIIDIIEKELVELVEKLKQKDYLFIDDIKDIDNVSSNLYNYLNRRMIKLNRHYGWECNKLSLTDIRKLRGQHLIKDGVRLETIMELFLHQNVSEFKEFLEYEDLIANVSYSAVESIFKEHTNLNIFAIDDYNPEELFNVVGSKGDECTLVLHLDTIDVVEFNSVAAEVYKIDEYYLVDQLYLLNNGEYLVVGDLKFYKY